MKLKNFGELQYIKEDDKLGYLLEGMGLASEQHDLLNKKNPTDKDKKRIEEIFRREEEIVILVEFLEGNLVEKTKEPEETSSEFKVGDRVQLIKEHWTLNSELKLYSYGIVTDINCDGKIIVVDFGEMTQHVYPDCLKKVEV